MPVWLIVLIVAVVCVVAAISVAVIRKRRAHEASRRAASGDDQNIKVPLKDGEVPDDRYPLW